MSLDAPSRVVKTEEILTDALLFILCVKLKIPSLAQAKAVATTVKLDALLNDAVMIGQLDMMGRPPLSFDRLIKSSHFEMSFIEQQALYGEFPSVVAASAGGRTDIDTHYWHASSRLWAERPKMRSAKRGPISAAVAREQARNQVLHLSLIHI